MIIITKKVGETPLELLNRLRAEKPEFKNEKLSYAGRLDPMAEGEMLIIVGDENKNREKYLGFDKEYLATFLIGVKTDAGDILGIIENPSSINIDQIDNNQIIFAVDKLKEIKTQKYPWFSGRTVNGIKLFDYFKSGSIDIERPSRNVEIKKSEFIRSEIVSAEMVREYIVSSVNKVKGDFRQKQILESWQEFFKTMPQQMMIFEVSFVVSTGTFIRDLTNNFPFSNALLKLKRTKILHS